MIRISGMRDPDRKNNWRFTIEADRADVWGERWQVAAESPEGERYVLSVGSMGQVVRDLYRFKAMPGETMERLAMESVL